MTVDVVSGKIGVGIGSPDQIHEGRLPHSRRDRLEARWHSRREDVMRGNLHLSAILAFHFSGCLAGWRNYGHDGDAIVVGFLPLEAVIDKLRRGGSIQGDLSDRVAGGTAFFAAIKAIDIPQVSYLSSLRRTRPAQPNPIGRDLGLQTGGRRP